MWRSTKSERIISATSCYDSYSVSWWLKNAFNKNGCHIWPLQHPVRLLPTLVNAASAPWPLWLKVWENPNNSNMSSSETLEGFKFLQKTYSHSSISSKGLSGCCTAHEPASADRCAEGCPCSSHHQDPPEDTQAHFIMHQITFSLYKSYRCLHRLRLAKKKNVLLILLLKGSQADEFMFPQIWHHQSSTSQDSWSWDNSANTRPVLFKKDGGRFKLKKN